MFRRLCADFLHDRKLRTVLTNSWFVFLLSLSCPPWVTLHNRERLHRKEWEETSYRGVLLKIQIIGIYQPYKNNIFPTPLSPALQFIQHKSHRSPKLGAVHPNHLSFLGMHSTCVNKLLCNLQCQMNYFELCLSCAHLWWDLKCSCDRKRHFSWLNTLNNLLCGVSSHCKFGDDSKGHR